MIIKHINSNKVIASNIKEATTFSERLIGLMFRPKMDISGLMIEPCTSIHNCFVRFPIDVIFLTQDNQVVKVIRSFKPWRFSWIYFRARRVLELPENTIPEDVKEGDYLEVTLV